MLVGIHVYLGTLRHTNGACRKYSSLCFRAVTCSRAIDVVVVSELSRVHERLMLLFQRCHVFTSGRCCCFRGVTCSRAVDVVVTEVSRVHECEQLEQRQQLAELQQKLNDSSREHEDRWARGREAEPNCVCQDMHIYVHSTCKCIPTYTSTCKCIMYTCTCNVNVHPD